MKKIKQLGRFLGKVVRVDVQPFGRRSTSPELERPRPQDVPEPSGTARRRRTVSLPPHLATATLQSMKPLSTVEEKSSVECDNVTRNAHTEENQIAQQRASQKSQKPVPPTRAATRPRRRRTVSLPSRKDFGHAVTDQEVPPVDSPSEGSGAGVDEAVAARDDSYVDALPASSYLPVSVSSAPEVVPDEYFNHEDATDDPTGDMPSSSSETRDAEKKDSGLKRGFLPPPKPQAHSKNPTGSSPTSEVPADSRSTSLEPDGSVCLEPLEASAVGNASPVAEASLDSSAVSIASSDSQAYSGSYPAAHQEPLEGAEILPPVAGDEAASVLTTCSENNSLPPSSRAAMSQESAGSPKDTQSRTTELEVPTVNIRDQISPTVYIRTPPLKRSLSDPSLTSSVDPYLIRHVDPSITAGKTLYTQRFPREPAHADGEVSPGAEHGSAGPSTSTAQPRGSTGDSATSPPSLQYGRGARDDGGFPGPSVVLRCEEFAKTTQIRAQHAFRHGKALAWSAANKVYEGKGAAKEQLGVLVGDTVYLRAALKHLEWEDVAVVGGAGLALWAWYVGMMDAFAYAVLRSYWDVLRAVVDGFVFTFANLHILVFWAPQFLHSTVLTCLLGAIPVTRPMWVFPPIWWMLWGGFKALGGTALAFVLAFIAAHSPENKGKVNALQQLGSSGMLVMVFSFGIRTIHAAFNCIAYLM
ncbi:hypothetical protein CYMTET_8806 [Cymbomonas tetramitiformis]|uniref:Uncharacterized protein n=1 Tax=Cymbomonas tetramitiformis TaxID=36881 RepID=A0AAE0GSB5_9CHLO|nr:hypothetical protein CYMTET_8806 [Cymbomonas tetramitiformis]